MTSSSYDLRSNALYRQQYNVKRDAAKLPRYANIPDIIYQRSWGQKKQIGATDTLVSTLYNSFHVINQERIRRLTLNQCWGGIFNLEFSLDGKILLAACEGKQILLYDAGNHRHLRTVENAHFNCVNCIKFLTDTTFATGSDDALIKLWDLRNLKTSKSTLRGHTSWVKNIEWSEQEKVMVTSAFDGTIYAWNLNEVNDENIVFEKVFLMKELMRMKLTPDGTKMIISTTNGYLIIIHNLHLSTFASDVRSFRPGLYRLMQLSHQSFPIGTNYNYLFNPARKRNRIEFVDDFPNEARAISSLQIHPHGWSAVSRNLNTEEKEEWTTVHDIQDRDEKDYKDAFEIATEETYVEDRENNSEESRLSHRANDFWLNYVSINDYRTEEEIPRFHQELDVISSGLIGPVVDPPPQQETDPNERKKIIKNLNRITHYIQEQNVGKGFIKVLSFSSDGRIIASPYDRGVRLLGFNETCQELSECVPGTPQELRSILAFRDLHRDIVVSCKFNPTNYQLVTGCLASDINWFQPVL